MGDTNLELTGRQREQLCDALISAFPTRTEMARLVNFKLDVDLEVVAGGETYADVVFNIIQDHQSTCMPVGVMDNWFVPLREAGAAVCRLELDDSFATAFLVGPDLVMTCYHVLQGLTDRLYYENPVTCDRTALTPEGVALRFGCTQETDGLTTRPGHVYRLAADWLVDCSPTDELDYVLLRVDGMPGTDEVQDNPTGRIRNWLRLSEPYEFQCQAPLFVLQHVNGGPLAVNFGTVARVKRDGTHVEIITQTDPGSSGAPCLSTR